MGLVAAILRPLAELEVGCPDHTEGGHSFDSIDACVCDSRGKVPDPRFAALRSERLGHGYELDSTLDAILPAAAACGAEVLAVVMRATLDALKARGDADEAAARALVVGVGGS